MPHNGAYLRWLILRLADLLEKLDKKCTALLAPTGCCTFDCGQAQPCKKDYTKAQCNSIGGSWSSMPCSFEAGERAATKQARGRRTGTKARAKKARAKK